MLVVLKVHYCGDGAFRSVTLYGEQEKNTLTEYTFIVAHKMWSKHSLCV